MSTKKGTTNRIIIALDYEDADPAWRLVDALGDVADYYKVGLQLLTASGPEIVRKLVKANKRVFLDLKTLEIPNSVAGAVDSAGRLGASMVTVHASGGSKVLEAAVKAARPYPQLNVLALTVITNMTDSDLEEIGITSGVEEQVCRLADLAIAAGCNGLVASPLETLALRARVPEETLIVTPGIQLEHEAANDHKRAATPRLAIEAGASYLVIGRSITKAESPLDAFIEATKQVS